MSRELQVCGRRGHVTYAPDEAGLRARLAGSTALGETWRCLRCGDFVLGPPRGHGPAAQAPVPARDKALRQALVLRILAVERVLRALVLIAAAVGVWRFRSAQTSLRGLFDSLLPAARPLAERLGVDIDSSWLVRTAEHLLREPGSTLSLAAVALAGYGALELMEGVGLWLQRRWAEYLTVVATAVFLPLEIHELLRGITATRLAAFGINVAAVVYLVLAKRLFGARGGRVAYERELRGDSLLEVQAAASDAGSPQRAISGRDVGMGERTGVA